MLKFTHVEDYIELLAGYEPGKIVVFNSGKYNFSLARYDVNIVQSMATASMWNNQAYTDKQGELAVKLVLKYKRQFALAGIDISPVEENPTWRQPLRVIDRTLRIWREGDSILVKFPYNSSWIEDFKKLKDTGQGSSQWDHDAKVWRLALTEYNVNWVVTWGDSNKFDIDPKVRKLYEQVIAAEAIPYAIMLTREGNRLTITNAADSLVDYVNSKLGGFGLDNITQLVDNSGVLGYTVDPQLQYPELLDLFGLERIVHVPSTEPGSMELIFDYAELTGRWPVCIYNPGTTQTVDLSRFPEDKVVRFDPTGRTKTCDYNYYDVKVIYANRIPKDWSYPIPLLVSTVEMMYGGKRMEWVNRAEKIIHYSYVPLTGKI